MLNMLQINLHHSKLASSNLVSVLAKEDIDIVLIQEPWIRENSQVCGLKLKGFTLCHVKGEGRVRSCVMIKSNLNFLFAEDRSDEDVVVVVLRVGSKTLTTVSAYFPIDNDTIPSGKIQQVVDKGDDYIIGCDANAHNVIWGSSDNNERGESLLDYIINKNIIICNRGKEPTFENRIRSEVIDLTLCSERLKESITGWKVWGIDSFSDHNFIKFKVGCDSLRNEPRRNPRNTNWTRFGELVNDRIGKESACLLGNVEDLDKKVDWLSDTLLDAYEKSCPLPKKRSKQNPPWWNTNIAAEVKEIRKLRNKLRSKAKGSNSQEVSSHWDVYKEKKRLLGYNIRKAKRESWRTYCEGIESSNEASRLRKVLAKDNSPPSFIKRSDGTWAESETEIMAGLLDAHFPDSTSIEEVPPNDSFNRTSEYIVNQVVSEKKVKWAIDSFDPYKSAGVDGIFPAMLQNTKEILLPLLTEIFKATLRLGYVPTKWREVRVVFIQKAGRTCHSLAKDYRPISLSSFLLKTMERLIDFFIRENLDYSKLSKSQHAYWKGKSTETALHKIVSSIEDSVMCNEYTLAAFIDIEGAFNNVKTCSITKALEKQKINQSIISWINEMLRGRIIRTELAGKTERRRVNRGTPQGGVISPLLWLLVVDEVLLKLEKKGVTPVGYADDIAILARGKFTDTLSELIEGALNTVKSWAENNGLGVNADKTELVLFTRRYKIPKFNLPRLNGAEIQLSDKAKYLGIILDRKLNWKLNIEERRRKALIAWFTVSKCLGSKWGLKPNIGKWIYTAVVRPILTYGALVWWNATKVKDRLNRINTVQRQSCLSITGALKSTPTEALEVILHIIPLDLHMVELAGNSALRLLCLGHFKEGSRRGHRSIVGRINVCNTRNSDYTLKELSFGSVHETELPARELWASNQVIREGELQVYTDGSKTSQGTGSGVFIEEMETRISCRLDDECTVFQAEVYALKLAAEHLKETNVTGRNISLYVDSQAAIRAIETDVVKSNVVKECKGSVMELTKNNSVRVCWVPGHEEYKGNEEADKLAKEGAEKTSVEATQSVKPPLSSFKKKMKDTLMKEWCDRWKSTHKYKITKYFWPTIELKKSKECISSNKKAFRTLVGTFTGHCLLGKHAKRIGIAESDLCRICQDLGSEEDIIHLICKCPALDRFRLYSVGAFCMLEEDLGRISIKHIKDFIKELRKRSVEIMSG